MASFEQKVFKTLVAIANVYAQENPGDNLSALEATDFDVSPFNELAPGISFSFLPGTFLRILVSGKNIPLSHQSSISHFQSFTKSALQELEKIGAKAKLQTDGQILVRKNGERK